MGVEWKKPIRGLTWKSTNVGSIPTLTTNIKIMKQRAEIKIKCMIEGAKRDLDNEPFWKIATEDALALIDAQLREIETLEYIYNLIQNDNEEN